MISKILSACCLMLIDIYINFLKIARTFNFKLKCGHNFVTDGLTDRCLGDEQYVSLPRSGMLSRGTGGQYPPPPP